MTLAQLALACLQLCAPFWQPDWHPVSARDSRNLHTQLIVLTRAACCALAQVILVSCPTLCQDAKRFWCQDAKRVGARCHRAW